MIFKKIILLLILGLFSCSDDLSTETDSETDSSSNNCSYEDTKRIFVTFNTYFADELQDADEICEAEKLKSIYPVGGDYKAWVSTSSNNPNNSFTKSECEYFLRDGDLKDITIADDWNDLTDGTITHQINYNLDGQQINGEVWTNTDPQGESFSSINTCGDWTSQNGSVVIGMTNSVNEEWTQNQSGLCSERRYIYCVQQ